VGSIPELSNDSVISELNLSFNHLEEDIPLSIQLRSFQSLDLSNNFLKGVLHTSFEVSRQQQTIRLSSNRLSGPLPLSISALSSSSSTNITELSVLEGNSFSCLQGSSSVFYWLWDVVPSPNLDHYADSYVCGSYEFDVGIQLVVLMSVLWVTIYFVYFRYNATLLNPGCTYPYRLVSTFYLISHRGFNHYQQFENSAVYLGYLQKFLMDYRRRGSKGFKAIIDAKAYAVVLECLQYLMVIFVGTLIGLFLLYILFHYTVNAIVAHDYNYVSTVVYIHGLIPAIVMGCIIMITIWLFCFYQNLLLKLFKAHNVLPEQRQASRRSFKSRALQVIIVSSLHAALISTNLLVNVYYVFYILDSNHSSVELAMVQIALALYKVVWGVWLVIPSSVKFLERYQIVSNRYIMVNHYFMLVMSSIFIPIVATSIANPNCFKYLLYAPDGVTTTSAQNQCAKVYCCDTSVKDQCPLCCSDTIAVTFTSTFIPSFQYSYACVTSLLAIYIPVLMYKYILSIFISPMVIYHKTGNPRPFLVIDYQLNDRFRAKKSIAELMMHLTMLLTFGMTSPILGLLIGASIYYICHMRKVLMGYFLNRDQSEFTVDVLTSSTTACMERSSQNEEFETIAENTLMTCNPMTKGISPFEIRAISDEKQAASTSSKLKSKGFLSWLASLVKQPAPSSTASSSLEYVDAWYGIFSCFIPTILIISLFWSLLFIDMIGDEYGFHIGFFCSLGFFLLCGSIGVFATYGWLSDRLERCIPRYHDILAYQQQFIGIYLQFFVFTVIDEQDEAATQGPIRSKLEREINSMI
jgi:hypothetical protein